MSITRSLPNAELIPRIAAFLKEGKTVTFRVKGYSMRPFLENGRDLVQLESVSAELKVGDVVLAEISPSVFVLHRIIEVDGECLTLKGDGNVWGTECCSVKDVLGIATGFVRKGRNEMDLVCGRKWRIYSYWWLKFSPLRRYLLAFYSRCWLKIFPSRQQTE